MTTKDLTSIIKAVKEFTKKINDCYEDGAKSTRVSIDFNKNGFIYFTYEGVFSTYTAWVSPSDEYTLRCFARA